jgi:quercetin dioxygenase-like cupin family protein
MKQRINTSIFLAFLMAIVFLACNSKTKKEEPAKTDQGKTETIPGFDPAMDATKITGYPATVLADTLGLKAYEFVANPGDSIPAHEHPDHVIYVMEGGTAEIKAKDGTVQTAEFKKGSCIIGGPTGHSAKNTGTTPLKLLIVHVYRPRS